MGALAARWRAWRQPGPHPATGDMLTPGEMMTWRLMGIYRRWSVFLGLQALTIAWWLEPGWFPGGIIGWNALWSDLAVVVEMMVGIAFIGQNMRDARVIREELAELREDGRLIREIHAALAPGGAGKVVVRDGAALELEREPGR